MRGKTTVGKWLKRLAERYAQACVDLSWMGSCLSEEHEGIKRRHVKARDALYFEIDRLTQVDLTPRAVLEQ